MFSARRIRVTGLVRIALPNHTIRLSGGGWLDFDNGTGLGAERYMATDEIFGTIASIANQSEGSNDAAPGGTITFLPSSNAAVAALSAPGMQSSPIEFWQVEIDSVTGQPIGAELMMSGKLDYTLSKGSRGTRELEMGFIGEGDWLFSQDEGNRLSDFWHQQWWPGELGMSNITGVARQSSWGVESPTRTPMTASDYARDFFR